jgi:hypothetical protein
MFHALFFRLIEVRLDFIEHKMEIFSNSWVLIVFFDKEIIGQ